jgi:hypothetical protein
LNEPDASARRRRLAHRDDATLTVSLAPGRFSGPVRVESEVFRTWIDTLWDLRASAPEWPADAANLGRWIRYLLGEKECEIVESVVHKITDQWNGTENEFNAGLPGDRPEHVAEPSQRTGAVDRRRRRQAPSAA